MRRILATAALSVFALTSVAAMAETGEAGKNRHEKFKQKMQERWEETDANKDGVVSKEEFLAKAEERFKKMDADGDGKVTEDERKAMQDKYKDRKKALKEGKEADVGGE